MILYPVKRNLIDRKYLLSICSVSNNKTIAICGWVDDDLVALCQLKVDVDCIICAHHLSFVLHEIIA